MISGFVDLIKSLKSSFLAFQLSVWSPLIFNEIYIILLLFDIEKVSPSVLRLSVQVNRVRKKVIPEKRSKLKEKILYRGGKREVKIKQRDFSEK